MAKGSRRIDETLAIFARELPRLRGQAATLLVGKLRMLAITEGMTPLAELADGLAAALIADRAATPIASWVDAMHHAAKMGPGDHGASPLLLATVGVRLAC